MSSAAGSSNGRTVDFGSAYHGSNPCPAALDASLRGQQISAFIHRRWRDPAVSGDATAPKALALDLFSRFES